MATNLFTLAPRVLPAGQTTSAPFTIPQNSLNQIQVTFTVQSPDNADTSKTLDCSLNDLTTGLQVAGITGWQGGILNRQGQLAPPGFGVSGVADLSGHQLQLVVITNSTLNTGISVDAV